VNDAVGPTPPTFPFIVARGRSGTTLLRAMFDAHPQMAVPHESHFVIQFAGRRGTFERPGGFDVDRFTRELFRHWAFHRWDLPEDEVRRAYEAAPPRDFPDAIRGLYGAFARHRGKTRYADKTPSYVLHVAALGALLPEAKVIHLVRDGRDVTLSYLATDFGSQTLGQAAIAWDRYVRAGREAGARLGPDRYLEVRYEDLLAEPQRVLEGLCAFVDLEFDERMLRFHERAGSVLRGISHAEHHQNLKRPLTAGLRDWRRDMSPRGAEVFDVLAGDLLEELGYGRSTDRPSLAASVVALRYRFGTGIRSVAHGLAVRIRKLRRFTRRRPVEATSAGGPARSS
jgi:hypothetical protein